MERVRIPALDREVSRVALGTWSMGGWMWGGADTRAARATIHRALDEGIDIIDTAPVYGFGLSEELVGDVLAERGCRDQVVIATKFGMVFDERHEPWRDCSPASIRREVHASLKRLRTDVIDIYQAHWPDDSTPFEETAAELERLRDEGLVKAVGVCNYSAAQMAAFEGGGHLDTTQFRYNIFERAPEAGVLPYAISRSLATFAYSPLARGLLTGTMTSGHEAHDQARRAEMFHGEAFERHLAAVTRLDEFARREYGRRVIHLAIRWVLDQPGMLVALWGARKPEQLSPVSGVWGFSIDDDARAEIDRIVAEETGAAR
ncbi:MAG: aldo/keto reductase [Coriobacteriales bacterium]|nr:aldo/keto reductase [Actinomycetes bacterium]